MIQVKKLPFGVIVLWSGIILCSGVLGSCSGGGVTGAVDSAMQVDAVVDLMVPDSAGPDLQPQETVQEDIEPEECLPGEGCFLEACEENDDCLSGICSQHLGGKVCTESCDESCPDGWRCLLVSGGSDGSYVCVSNFSHLCQPCFTGADCSNESSQNACILYQGEGGFCGGSCDAETPCPEGYSCQQAEVVGGETSFQCVNDTLTCPCTPLSVELSKGTFCDESNDAGTCSGIRVCGSEGLSDCDASVPSEDICNGQDDDCDGTIDEGGCDDGNPCTEDLCAGENGCTNEPLDGTECLDGDVCTFGDHCEAGVCVGNPTECDDGNSCTVDACDASGACAFTPIDVVCEDGDPCTLADLCKEGICTPGLALQCDDGNPCTNDTCGDLGCLHEPNEGACDDGNACTVTDQCADGFCVGTEPLDCNDDNPCTDDACHPQAECLHTANAQPCDDGNACTLADICQASICSPGPGSLECVDGNQCTKDTCDPVIGCVFTALFGPCNDKNGCTVDDTCLEGSCTGLGTLACDDGNPCTLDGCTLFGGCTHTQLDGACSDGNACTVADTCVAGTCQPGSQMNCDDGNSCTADSCNAGGCVFSQLAGPCDDGNACTLTSLCKEGVCQGEIGVVCGDGNVCTTDFCTPAQGCISQNNAAPCDDGSICTVGDVCSGGACKSGPVLSCSDGNPCTDDACIAQQGCVFQQNSAPCDDGNACTLGDKCTLGSCLSQIELDCEDGNSCTKDSCNPVTGCKSVVVGGDCDDGNACTQTDECDGLECVGSNPIPCSDGNPCTLDGCEPKMGCIYADSNGAACDDGDSCTSDDACKNGQCQGAADLECDDGNACTDDLCLKVQGCKHVPNQNLCNDGDDCTVGDHCESGACVFDEQVQPPGNAGPISGKTNLCAGTGGHLFTIGMVPGADSYDWNLPNGALIEAGAGTQAITLQLGSNSGVLKVTPKNGCGAGNPAAVSITATFEPSKPGFISGPSGACSTSKATYSVQPVAGADSYDWDVPADWSVVGGQGSTSIEVLIGSQDGSVTVRAANDCGESAIATLAVASKACLPPGIIVPYTGFLGNIPEGWLVCDGSNETPNLQSRFIRGASPGLNPGFTGGDPSSHNHGSATGVTELNTGTTGPGGRNCSGSSCAWKTKNTAHHHKFNHSHSMPVVTSENLPPFYEVLFLQNESAFTIPEGALAYWYKSANEVPDGWGICDGIEATPNLHERYLRGASSGQSAGALGGSLTHSHAAKTGSHGAMADHISSSSTVGCGDSSATGGSHTHTFTHDHTIPLASHEPPFITLIPIRALNDATPSQGTVLLWADALGDIPDGWSLCDGSGATPDTRTRFVKGSVEQAGTVGGSLTHVHQADAVSGTSSKNSGGSGSCTNGAEFMAFHSHQIPAHKHVLSTVGNVPNHMELLYIIKQ